METGDIVMWSVLGVIYLFGVVYSFYDRYGTWHRRARRMDGLLSFKDWQANIMILVWPVTLVLAIAWGFTVVFIRRRHERATQQRAGKGMQ